jgi:hypothetical protein
MTKPKPKPGKSLDDQLNTLETTKVNETTPKTTETISKTEAIRRALAAGRDKPSDVVQWIKEQYDMDVSSQMISTVKYGLAKQGVTTTGKGNPARPVRPAARSTTAGSISIDLVKQMKAMIQEHGAESVRDAVELVAD